ncbi:hypothetical protein BJ122_102154 [Rhodopseudomonas faecalis]|uniref:Uncharacterized protein n=1 Tax=Rhodopseudomonas faecalis TaxID=99655 RepID=A0A318TPK4_9BRAD|nr:hypothetical protein BJ122_102154 [Rhodopseudomonas faecalis]
MKTTRATSSAKTPTGRTTVAARKRAAKTSAAKASAAKTSATAKTAKTARATSTRKAAKPPVVEREEAAGSLIERVERAVEREIAQIEAMVGGADELTEPRSDAERRARTLASLTRTLLELRRLRADDDVQRTADDDAIPRDLDELRRALSRRLDQLVDGAAPLSAAGDE